MTYAELTRGAFEVHKSTMNAMARAYLASP